MGVSKMQVLNDHKTKVNLILLAYEKLYPTMCNLNFPFCFNWIKLLSVLIASTVTYW